MSYRVGDVVGKGRALLAARAIKPGEVVFTEESAALVLDATDASAEAGASSCHHMLAQMFKAGRSEEHAEAIANLCAFVAKHREQDAELFEAVVRHATPAVKRLVGAEHASAVDEITVVELYSKHLLNSMGILSAETLAPIGMGLYPHRGALLNHADQPNCWTLFEQNKERSSYTLSLRALTPIKPDDELTIAYMDTAKRTDVLHAHLEQRYFIPRPPASTTSSSSSSSSSAASVDDLIAEMEKLGSLELGGPLEVKEAADLIPAVTSALNEASRADSSAAVLGCCRQLIQLYKPYYRVVHPLAALRHMQGALAALRLPGGPDVSLAAELSSKASFLLTITHGKEHELTKTATETKELTASLKQAMLAKQGGGGAVNVS